MNTNTDKTNYLMWIGIIGLATLLIASGIETNVTTGNPEIDSTCMANQFASAETGGTLTCATPSGGGSNIPTTESVIEFTDNFLWDNTGTSVVNSVFFWSAGFSSGSIIGATTVNRDNNHQGVLSLLTSTTSGTFACITSAGNAVIPTTNWNSTWIVNIPTASGGITSVLVRAGMFQSTACGPTVANGWADFVYSNSGNWICESDDGTTLKTVDSGVAITADTWFKLTLTHTSTPSFLYYINGVLKCTITTNLPPATGLHFTASVVTNTGARRQFLIDWFHARLTGLTR